MTPARTPHPEMTDEALAEFERLVKQLNKQRRSSRDVEKQCLTGAELGRVLTAYQPRGRPTKGRGAKPFTLSQTGISKDDSADFRRLGRYSDEQIKHACDKIRSHRDWHDVELTRRAVIRCLEYKQPALPADWYPSATQFVLYAVMTRVRASSPEDLPPTARTGAWAIDGDEFAKLLERQSKDKRLRDKALLALIGAQDAIGFEQDVIKVTRLFVSGPHSKPPKPKPKP